MRWTHCTSLTNSFLSFGNIVLVCSDGLDSRSGQPSCDAESTGCIISSSTKLLSSDSIECRQLYSRSLTVLPITSLVIRCL